MDSIVERGIIVNYKNKLRYGFIQGEQESIFFHATVFISDQEYLQNGREVEYKRRRSLRYQDRDEAYDVIIADVDTVLQSNANDTDGIIYSEPALLHGYITSFDKAGRWGRIDRDLYFLLSNVMNIDQDFCFDFLRYKYRTVYKKRPSTRHIGKMEAYDLEIEAVDLGCSNASIMPISIKPYASDDDKNNEVNSSQFTEDNIRKLFGVGSAEMEKTTLEKYYIKPSLYEDLKCSTPMILLVGVKGVGKTSLFYMSMESDRLRKRIPILLRPNDLLDIPSDTSYLGKVMMWKDRMSEVIVKKIIATYFKRKTLFRNETLNCFARTGLTVLTSW